MGQLLTKIKNKTTNIKYGLTNKKNNVIKMINKLKQWCIEEDHPQTILVVLGLIMVSITSFCVSCILGGYITGVLLVLSGLYINHLMYGK